MSSLYTLSMKVQQSPLHTPPVERLGGRGVTQSTASRDPQDTYQPSQADQELMGRRMVSAVVWGVRGAAAGGVLGAAVGLASWESTLASTATMLLGSMVGMLAGTSYGVNHPHGKTVDKIIRGDFEPGWGSFRGPGAGWTIGG